MSYYEPETAGQPERVQKIPISDLKPFRNHPFRVVDDESMLRTTESISMFGVLTPLLARPLSDGSLEIISGHRRARAAEVAGLTEVPVIVRKMTDDEAVVLMVDSNLQRENILPSERAFDEPVGLIMNEEGKLDGLPLNRALRDDDGKIYDVVAGPFLVVGLTEESFGSLTPEQLAAFEEKFHSPEVFVRMGRGIMAIPVDEKATETAAPEMKPQKHVKEEAR